MKALLVGADRLGNIPSALQNFGIKEYIHWTGRKKGMRKMDLPNETKMIIIFYDFVEHNITEVIKNKAKQHNIPCVFSKRACSELTKKLYQCTILKRCEKINNFN